MLNFPYSITAVLTIRWESMTVLAILIRQGQEIYPKDSRALDLSYEEAINTYSFDHNGAFMEFL